jgi:hypothetical protein
LILLSCFHLYFAFYQIEKNDISVTTNGSVNVSPKKKKKGDQHETANVESDENKASNNKKKKKKRNKGSLNDSTISDVSTSVFFLFRTFLTSSVSTPLDFFVFLLCLFIKFFVPLSDTG